MVALRSGKVILLSVIFARSHSSGEHSIMRLIMAKTRPCACSWSFAQQVASG